MSDPQAVDFAECPECFALVLPGRLTAHQYWHDQQTERTLEEARDE
jgi:hypothetical protein